MSDLLSAALHDEMVEIVRQMFPGFLQRELPAVLAELLTKRDLSIRPLRPDDAEMELYVGVDVSVRWSNEGFWLTNRNPGDEGVWLGVKDMRRLLDAYNQRNAVYRS